MATAQSAIDSATTLLRDRRDGTPQYKRFSQDQYLDAIKQALYRLYRSDRSMFFGIDNTVTSIRDLTTADEMPMVDDSFANKVIFEAVSILETTNQPGTRPAVADQSLKEESNG